MHVDSFNCKTVCLCCTVSQHTGREQRMAEDEEAKKYEYVRMKILLPVQSYTNIFSVNGLCC